MDELRIALAVPSAKLARYANYRETLMAFGARVALVEPNAPLVAPEYDGLALPGGADVDPALYGQPNTASRGVDRALDALQLAALDAFVRAGKPIFGICRGLQLINVYFGGTLIQHLPQSDRHAWDAAIGDLAHPTHAAAGSRIARLYGEAFTVNSAHHQAADRLGEGLTVTQRSEDGVVEALEHESLPLLAVQWHPERMCLSRARPDTVDGGALFAAFMEQCRRSRSA